MRSMKLNLFLTAFFFLLTAALAEAATVTGTVTDKTTGKPAAGDAVVLVEPMSGMSEVARTTTDAQGRYTLNLPGSNPYLIRVTHEGAESFIAAPEGGGNGDIAVYDVAATVSGVTLAEHVVGVESDNGQLRVVERYDIHNASTPPRTQWSKKSFEVILPQDATPADASAQRPGAGSLATSVKLDPDGPKGHYSFDFPIQPDDGGKGTLFTIQYEVPYASEKYTFHSAVTVPAKLVWVVLPKSMTFSGSGFEPSQQEPSVQTYMAQNAAPGKEMEFTVGGEGAFPRQDQGNQADNGAQGGPGSGPGGGLGEPINTPDPLSKYRWWILGGLALLLVVAAAFLLRRPAAAVPAGGPDAFDLPPAFPAKVAAHASTFTAAAAPAGMNSALLSALKDELFALESEKIAGTLDAKEYAEQKAALETVLRRALKKS
jgi:Carboxypeptidase regulatory-like domain